MSRIKRILCAALAFMVMMSIALADETNIETTSTPTPTENVTTATASPTQSPADEAVASTLAPKSTQSAAPTATPTAEPTAAAEPTATPTTEPTPTVEPTVTPTVEPTLEPTVAPVTGLNITVGGNAQLVDGVYRVTYQTAEDLITFQWPAVDQAILYNVEITDAQGNVVHSTQSGDLTISLPAGTFTSDQYTMKVQAMTKDGVLNEDEVKFILTQSSGMPDFPEGGFPGGSFPSGSMSGGAMMEGMAATPGFQVTPGEALINSHANGTKDMQIYGTVELEVSEELMSILIIDDTELGICLDDGDSPFYASIEENVLILTPETDGSEWSINAFTLKILQRSGIESIKLVFGETVIEVSTALDLQGNVYGKLCAAGYVSKDYTLSVAADGTTISVAGETYQINEKNELVGR